jgi:hypothetical protein
VAITLDLIRLASQSEVLLAIIFNRFYLLMLVVLAIFQNVKKLKEINRKSKQKPPCAEYASCKRRYVYYISIMDYAGEFVWYARLSFNDTGAGAHAQKMVTWSM